MYVSDAVSLIYVCYQRLFHTVIDHIAQFTVTNEQFDVVKRDMEAIYLNQSMKPEKLNKLVIFFNVDYKRDLIV
jgi:hypothetical protein